MGQIGGPPTVTQSDLEALRAAIPTPGTEVPPAVQDTGARGTELERYARADHTHASRARRARMQSAADGSLVWAFDPPFDEGVVPRIQALAETAVGVTDVVNVQIEGPPTNTSVRVRVTRAARSVASLLGLTVLSIPSSPGVTWVHLSAFEA